MMHQSDNPNQMIVDMDDIDGMGDNVMHDGHHMMVDMDDEELQHHYN